MSCENMQLHLNSDRDKEEEEENNVGWNTIWQPCLGRPLLMENQPSYST